MGISDRQRHGGEGMTFGERLYELRNKNNLSQEELAEVLDVSRQSISKWENDKGYPEMTRLLFMSDYFDVSLDYLMRGIKKENNEEDQFESFALKVNRKVSKEELLSKFNFIKNSFEFGEIIRAKGIVDTNNGKEQFDYTLSEINMEKIAYRGESVISFIGTNLNRDKIKNFFL